MRDANQATDPMGTKERTRHAARAIPQAKTNHWPPAPTDPAGNGGGEAMTGATPSGKLPRQKSPRAKNSTLPVSETREGGGGHAPDETHSALASPDETPDATKGPPERASEVARQAGGGQFPREAHHFIASPDETPGAIPDTEAKELTRQEGREGHASVEAHTSNALPATETPSAVVTASTMHATHSAGEPEAHIATGAQRPIDLRFTDPTIAEIVETWRSRQDMVRAQNRLTLQIKSICRRFTAGDKTEADKLYRSMQNGQEHPLAERCYLACVGLLRARDPVEEQRHAYEKHITRLAKQLPIWPVVEGIRGVGPLALGAIVGECGDLSAYKSVSAVWKRAGLAVIDGGRQRRVSGDAALLHGYSPERRAVFFTISDALLKSQGKGDAAGPYRRVYDARKEYERPRVESDGHAHNRALRIMCKRLLRDLTREWRRIARNT